MFLIGLDFMLHQLRIEQVERPKWKSPKLRPRGTPPLRLQSRGGGGRDQLFEYSDTRDAHASNAQVHLVARAPSG